jgi:hypothetical protein
MLLPDNVHPENTLMYNGALIMKALKIEGETTLLDLYFEAKKENKMTMALFVLSLDWLFLADCVTFNEYGGVTLCS